VIRVLVAEDMQILRDTLSALLRLEDDIDVVAEATDGDATAELSYGTVRNYLASAVTKLDARNRVDAVRIAAEAGWL